MKSSNRHLIRMVLFLAVVGLGAAVIYPSLLDAFFGNAVLNGMILSVLFFGIFYIFRQVFLLDNERKWLVSLQRETEGGAIFSGAVSRLPEPRLLAPIATMLSERAERAGGRLSLSTLSMRTLLDGAHARIQESHEISRYLIGLLIFLGLLGTFWGLLETVSSVGDTIAGLGENGDQNPLSFFSDLKAGLERPLSGMATAFSSSLFGLAGSLVLGFLELQAGQVHNRFMNHLEDWLSSMTKLSSGTNAGGDPSAPAYISALLEQTAEAMEKLQQTLAKGEETALHTAQALTQLNDRMGILTEHMQTQQSVMLSLAETQQVIKPLLHHFADAIQSSKVMEAPFLDEHTRTHIRNLDLRLEQFIKESERSRAQTVQDIRNEIRLLTKTMAAIAEET